MPQCASPPSPPPPSPPPSSSPTSNTEVAMAPVAKAQSMKHYTQILKSNLKKKFMCAREASTLNKDKQHLNNIYTELYIAAEDNEDIIMQHEVRQIEMARKHRHKEKPVKPRDMFKLPTGKDSPVKTVLTKGIAGIGKTFLVQRFVLDWAEGRANQDVHLLFPFTLRHLNLKKGQKVSLADLLQECIEETVEINKEALTDIFVALHASGNTNFGKSEFKLLFILDGLDESHLQLDCRTRECQTDRFDVTGSTSVDELLKNLIRGKLFPSARLWITTRPAAASQIHPDFVDIVTEVRGFAKPQKNEYIKKGLTDDEQYSTIISHIKSSQSLHIMCHIPVFCWIAATVLEDVLKTREGTELPKTLTEMYTKFLELQIKQTEWKYHKEKCLHDIKSLAKLAFQQLKKGNLIFYEKDLKESGIEFSEASVLSEMFSEIFKEEWGRNDEDKIFSFVHLSVQEFLAAVYVRMTFINHKRNLMHEPGDMLQCLQMLLTQRSMTKFHRFGIHQALQCPNGHWDLFLRFLLGLSQESCQKLLPDLLKKKGRHSESSQKTVEYIKKKIGENLAVEKSINLIYCLNELNDFYLVDEMQHYHSSGHLSTEELSPAQISALVFILLSSENILDVLDLKKYPASREAQMRLLPAIKVCKKAVLSDCRLSETQCEIVVSALKSQPNHLSQLELSGNNLQDSGVKMLCVGLESPHCRLEALRLRLCGLSETSCGYLVSALKSNPSNLKELDLSDNYLQDSGVKLLCGFLESTHSRLGSLGLKNCRLSETSCEYLVSVLKSSPSHLKHLDLSDNDLQDSGVQQLCTGLEGPQCRLQYLGLKHCRLSETSCGYLVSALKSNPSHLRELDLSFNKLLDPHVKQLSGLTKNPSYRLASVRWK
ncbi:NACHT, LRR and PYD domains-containing protein 12-like isoform X2 [Mastacembelus armatus]|nr:NACHT, LRR and PYD domains-containing protein 12-like isoform X2 [Mastacembelus armatus]